jgi:hypothetical protein
MFGDGLGGFLSAGASVPAGLGPQALVAADFNGDGKLDLAVAARDSNDVRILLGNGLGQFSLGGIVSVPTPRALVGADFNLDGHLDLAVANQGANTVTLLLGDGAGGLTAQTPVAVGSVPIALVTGDVNGDGRPDLAVADSTSNDVSVLLGDGLGGLTSGAPIALSSFPAAIAIGDFNADGNLDLVTVQAVSSDLHLLLGDGNGNFVEGVGSPFVAGSQPRAVTVGDFDLDGKLDLAVANAVSGNLSILAGNGAGGFTLAATRTVGTTPLAVVVEDFNGDGRPDIVAANGGSNDVSIQISNCTAGTQTVAVTSVTPSAFGQVVTFTATVSAVAPSAGQPTGSVSFKDGGIPIGVGSVNAQGLASFTTDTLTPGTHSIQTAYAGDASFSGSASTAFDQVVMGVNTVTTIGGAPASTALGEPLTLTVSVLPLTPGLPALTGSIVFRDGATSIGIAPLSGSTATFVTRSLASGGHTLFADYSGDANYSSSSSSMPYTVGPAGNSAAATARPTAVNSTVQTRVGGATPQVWYRVSLFANRSYQLSAWPVADEGATGAVALSMDVFSDAAGATPALPAPRRVAGGLEGSPNDPAGMNPETLTFQPSVSGVYWIRLGGVAAAEEDVNLLLRETTLFSSGIWVSTTNGYDTYSELHNNTAQPVEITLQAFSLTGTPLGIRHVFILPGNATVAKSAKADLLVTGEGVVGGTVLTHNGAFGAISGNATVLSGLTGLSFDKPFTTRSEAVAGFPIR